MDNRAIVHRTHAAGWNPLPLPDKEKYPPPAGTTGYDGVDLTTADIDALDWSGNLGVRVPADVIGLDVDAYHGGDETLKNLVTKLGIPLPHTYVSHSSRHDGSGIMFFRVPVGLAWVAGLAGIEIVQRGHRYAVVWPSIHPDDTAERPRRYYWLDQAEPDVVQPGPPQIDDLAELPWSWIEELSRADAGSMTQAVDLAGRDGFLAAHTQADAHGYFTSKVLHEFRDKWQAGNSRHDTMQHCLTWAMELVGAGIVGSEQAVGELGGVWQSAMVHEPQRAALWSPGVRATEFEAMLRHAIGKVKDRPQSWFDKLHDDIAGIAVSGATAAPADEVIVVYQPQSSALPAPIDWHDFVQRDTEAQTWLAEGFWPWGRSMALYADAKVGKSELALWIACQLALGRHPWTGDPVDPIHVAYFDFEMTADDLDDRLADFDIDPLDLAHLHYWQLPMIHPLDTKEGGGEVLALVKGCGAQASIFDTYGASVIGEENKADTVHAFTQHTGRPLKTLGVAYLRTDHTGKDPNQGQRGTSAKRGDVDVIWSQKRLTGNKVLLDCTGSTRVGWVKPKLELERTVVNDVVRYTTPVVMGVPAGTQAKAIELDKLGVPLDASRSVAVAALRAAKVKPGRVEVLTAALKHRREAAQRARIAATRGGNRSGTGQISVSGTGTGTDAEQATDPLQQ